MAIFSIPPDQDPRRPLRSTPAEPYCFDTDSFPPTLNLGGRPDGSVRYNQHARTWAQVVLHAALKEVEQGTDH